MGNVQNDPNKKVGKPSPSGPFVGLLLARIGTTPRMNISKLSACYVFTQIVLLSPEEYK